ncbi:hypothetical protein K435DRAFT_808685 [Dendrothele bispora CBS 962.96]|uniref:Uncharacterized protein n=1 Tax=Dendrothele bispora (strain CBS 962.96) TaxID=1314807 RepID=A0A4S8L0Z6_DENBC|nr:hypothetical protein K435DRAFT_808685 [Dendrothele bispora CBS 962.96]
MIRERNWECECFWPRRLSLKTVRLTPITRVVMASSKRRKPELALVPGGFVLSGDEAYDIPGKKTQGVLKSSVESEQEQGVYREGFRERCGRGSEEEKGPGQYGLSENELKVKGLQGLKRLPYLKQNTSMASTNTVISFGAGQQQRLKEKYDGVDLGNLEIGYE